jgi:hypothetical protein
MADAIVTQTPVRGVSAVAERPDGTRLIEKATNRDLVTGLKSHLQETNKQVERLQKVFEKLGKQLSGTQCPAIDGIIKEADETASEREDKAVLDAAPSCRGRTDDGSKSLWIVQVDPLPAKNAFEPGVNRCTRRGRDPNQGASGTE